MSEEAVTPTPETPTEAPAEPDYAAMPPHERMAEAERELRRALYLSPYLAEAHLLLGRVHLRTGRTADAIQAFKIALWSADSAAGHLALAEAYLQSQNPTAAREEVDRALALDPTSAAARALRDKLAKPQ